MGPSAVAVIAAAGLASLTLKGCDLPGSAAQCQKQPISHGMVLSAKEGEPGQVDCDAGFRPGRLAPEVRCVALIGACDKNGKNCKKRYGFEEAVRIDGAPDATLKKLQKTNSLKHFADAAIVAELDDPSMSNSEFDDSSMNDNAMMSPMRRLASSQTSKPSPFTLPFVCEPTPGGPDCPSQAIPSGRLQAADRGDPVRIVCDPGFAQSANAVAKLRCTDTGFRRFEKMRRHSRVNQSRPLGAGCCVAAPAQKFVMESSPVATQQAGGGSSSFAAVAMLGPVSVVLLVVGVLRGSQQKKRRHEDDESSAASDTDAPLE